MQAKPQKLDLNKKISLISPTQIFNTVIIPAATYGHLIFKDLISAEAWNNHKRQLFVIFFTKYQDDCRRRRCQCIFCFDEISDNGHVCCCPALQGVTILERLKNLVYCHYVPKINRESETKLYNNRMHCDKSDSSL